MCACRSKCTYWMGATALQRCELFVNYFAVYLTGHSSAFGGQNIQLVCFFAVLNGDAVHGTTAFPHPISSLFTITFYFPKIPNATDK